MSCCFLWGFTLRTQLLQFGVTRNFLKWIVKWKIAFHRFHIKGTVLLLYCDLFSFCYRLTPTYMFVLLFYAKMTGFLGEGPLWYKEQRNPACDKYWWTNLLYINNFWPKGFQSEVCVWVWPRFARSTRNFLTVTPVTLGLHIIIYVRGCIARSANKRVRYQDSVLPLLTFYSLAAFYS